MLVFFSPTIPSTTPLYACVFFFSTFLCWLCAKVLSPPPPLQRGGGETFGDMRVQNIKILRTFCASSFFLATHDHDTPYWPLDLPEISRRSFLEPRPSGGVVKRSFVDLVVAKKKIQLGSSKFATTTTTREKDCWYRQSSLQISQFVFSPRNSLFTDTLPGCIGSR